jgi:hypothetical protein
MAKKPRGAHRGSAAYAALSKDAKAVLSAITDIAEKAGHDMSDPFLVEVEPGCFIEVRLSENWRKFGGASPGNIDRARRLVDLAEAAFEAERATKQ